MRLIPSCVQINSLSQKKVVKKFSKFFFKNSTPPHPSEVCLFSGVKQTNSVFAAGYMADEAKNQKVSRQIFPPRSYLSENIYMLGSATNSSTGKNQFVSPGRISARLTFKITAFMYFIYFLGQYAIAFCRRAFWSSFK